ncbi:retinitis pigmentosa 1-like 1 protein [Thalassophryne amazonica]|uniref:retinitis pigmentosa 1-like 1 protein n=1 Tax=Thalassophryne amazonica TaxID=390379 RepID=UPI0014709B75|nr:retinitis pigmentosa 1-like 1 protein [Thalassophryne amazonica]
MDFSGDLTARVLLERILVTESPRTPVTCSSSETQSTSAVRRSDRLKKKDGDKPQDILRRSLKRKMHESVTRISLPPPKRRTSSVGLRKMVTPGPTSFLCNDDDTPRHILANILQTEPVKSPVIHEKAVPKEPQLPSAHSSINSGHPSTDFSGLDLTDVTIANLACSAKGLSRKRPRRSLNVTAFEKQLKHEDDVKKDADESTDSQLSLCSLSNSTTLNLKTPIVDLRLEKRGLQRKIPQRRKITEDEFGAGVHRRQMEGLSGTRPVDQSLSETAHIEGFSLGFPEPELSTDIFSCNTALYAQSDAMTSNINLLATQDKPTVLASQLHGEMGVGEQNQLAGVKLTSGFTIKEVAAVANPTEECSSVKSQSEDVDSSESPNKEEKSKTDYQPEATAAAISQSLFKEDDIAAEFHTEEESVADSQGVEEAGANSEGGEEVAAHSQSGADVAVTHSQGGEDEEAADHSQGGEDEEAAAHSQGGEDEEAAAHSQSGEDEEEAAADSQGGEDEEEAAADSQGGEDEEEAAADSQGGEEEEEEAAADSQGGEDDEEEEAAADSQGGEDDEEEEEAAADSQGGEDDEEEEEAAADSQGGEDDEEEAAADSQGGEDEEEAAADSQGGEDEEEEEEAAADSQGGEDEEEEEEAAADSQGGEDEEEEEEAAADSQGGEDEEEEEEAAADSQGGEEEEEAAADSQGGEEEEAAAADSQGGEDEEEEEEAAAADSQGGEDEEEEAAAADSQGGEDEEEEAAAADSQGGEDEEEEAAAADSQGGEDEEEEEEEAAADSQGGEEEEEEEEEAAADSQGGEEEAAADSQGEAVAAVFPSEERDVIDSQGDDDVGNNIATMSTSKKVESAEPPFLDNKADSLSEVEMQSDSKESGGDHESGPEDFAAKSQLNEGKNMAHSHPGCEHDEKQEDEDAVDLEDDEENAPHHLGMTFEIDNGEPVSGSVPDQAADQDEEWEDEEDNEKSEDFPIKTPAFVRERRIFFHCDSQASPVGVKSIQARTSGTSGGLPGAKPKQVKARKRKSKVQGCLPKSYLMGVFRHFAKTKVSADVYAVLTDVMEKFFQRMAEDLEAYAAHAKRKTIEVEDVELLLKRQGYVNDKVPVEVLIEKYLRMEQRKLLIPIATSGNIVVPKQRR